MNDNLGCNFKQPSAAELMPHTWLWKSGGLQLHVGLEGLALLVWPVFSLLGDVSHLNEAVICLVVVSEFDSNKDCGTVRPLNIFYRQKISNFSKDRATQRARGTSEAFRSLLLFKLYLTQFIFKLSNEGRMGCEIDRNVQWLLLLFLRTYSRHVPLRQGPGENQGCCEETESHDWPGSSLEFLQQNWSRFLWRRGSRQLEEDEWIILSCSHWRVLLRPPAAPLSIPSVCSPGRCDHWLAPINYLRKRRSHQGRQGEEQETAGLVYCLKCLRSTVARRLNVKGWQRLAVVADVQSGASHHSFESLNGMRRLSTHKGGL